MTSFRIVVEDDSRQVSQGTAWFVAPQLVLTAFHVVGPEGGSEWYHEIGRDFRYTLHDDVDGAPAQIRCDAVLAHSRADIALLKADRAVADGVLLRVCGAGSEISDPWRADGFPALRSGERLFALSGTVARIWEQRLRPQEGLQLTVEQPTYRPPQGEEKPLGGFSGAAIMSRDRVIGVMTRVASNMNTAFAADAIAIRELLLAHDCGQALIDCPVADLAVLAERIGAGPPAPARPPEAAIRRLLEHALRSEDAASKLRTIIETVSGYAPEVAQGLDAGLCAIEPLDGAIDRLAMTWQAHAPAAIDIERLIGVPADRMPGSADRPRLAMAIRLMAMIAFQRARSQPAIACRRALAILVFHDRQLLPALARIPARALAIEPADDAQPAHAAEASTDLASDVGLIEVSGVAGREIAARLRAIADLVPPQPPLEVPLLAPGTEHRFLFNTRAVPLLGREVEIGELDEFLAAEPRFAWWLLLGPAGSGKSRLALELCLRHRLVWRAGFLPPAADVNWSSWQPSQPTLIVADDAAARVEELNRIVGALRVRTDLRWPVRVLAIERFGKAEAAEDQFVEESWVDRFIGQGSAAALMQAARFAPPLTLQALAPAALWKVICAMARQAGGGTVDQTAALEMLQQLDPAGRPLFAALLGDAMAHHGNAVQWDMQALLNSILAHEEERWRAQNVKKPAEWNLLAVATMVAGIDIGALDWQAHPDTLLPLDQFSPERYRILSGRDATSFLAPLEPDIVGELFVLERVKPRFALDTARAAVLRGLSWRLKPQSMAAFLERTARDFPHHGGLPLLLGPVDGTEEIRRLWSMLAVNATFHLGSAGASARAVELYRSLQRVAGEFRADSSIRLRQARSAANLIAAFPNDPVQARTFYDDLDGLVADAAADGGIREAFARGAHNMVRTYLDRGDATEGLALYQRVKTVAAAHPNEKTLQTDQARCAYNLLDWHIDHHDGGTSLQMYGELAELSSRFDHAKLRELQAKGAVNLIPHAQDRDRLVADLANLATAHPAEKELLYQYGAGLTNAVSNSLPGQAGGYFTEVERNFADLDDLRSQLIHAKAAGGLLGCHLKHGELVPALKIYKTKLTNIGSDASLGGVKARAITKIIGASLSAGRVPLAKRMYSGDLTRLVRDHPGIAEVSQCFDLSTLNMRRFGGLS